MMNREEDEVWHRRALWYKGHKTVGKEGMSKRRPSTKNQCDHETLTSFLVSNVKICVCGSVKSRKYTENVNAGETERAERNFKIISRLCTFNALIGAIYTSPHGTDESTMYFNAHMSI